MQGYLKPALVFLSRPEEKPNFDNHVEGSHRVLVGFLVMEHCQCSGPGYVIRHPQMLLKAHAEVSDRFRRYTWAFCGSRNRESSMVIEVIQGRSDARSLNPA